METCAGVGALAGGKRGAVIGGLIGAGGGYVYSRRNRGRNYRQPYYGPQQPYYGGGGRAHSSAGRYYGGGYNGYHRGRDGRRHDGSRSHRGH